MALKPCNRSLLVPEFKRAGKTISGARSKSPFNVSPNLEDEKRITNAVKQEPEDELSCSDEDSNSGELDSSPPPSTDASATNTSAGPRSLVSYPSHTRVRSHSRSLRAMANPSAVWAHFDLCSNDPLRAQCRLCGAVVVRGGANPRQCGTTNLHRHLRVHHGGRLIGRRYQGN